LGVLVVAANAQKSAVQSSTSPLTKLQWLVGLRLLLASALLGSAVVLDLHQRLPFPTSPLYGLLAVTFGLSVAYAAALRSQRWLQAQVFAQLALDLILVSLLVHFTGGLDSVVPFMYIFVIFAAANVTEHRGGLIVGGLSVLLYVTLVLAEWTHAIRPVEFAGGLAPLRSTGYAVYQVLIHTVAFLAVAILSSHLSYRLRQAGQELERRGLDLRNLQTLHQSIVSNISSGLMTLDLEGRVVSFNEAAERITGYAFASLRDRSWQASPFADCPPMAEFFTNPTAPLVNSITEIGLRRRDGRMIPVGLSCSPLRQADGTTAGLVAIFQDLTERKRVEEQLRRADRLAALGQLAANIAHEVRNPLAAISGAVEVLREDLTKTGHNRQLLELLLGEAHRLKLITGQFLDFAKPQSLLFRPCAVRPLIEETLRLLERSGERHPDTTWTLIEHAPDAQVLADADQFRQVVWNLCLNAIQAMPRGGRLTVLVSSGLPPQARQFVNSSTGQLGRSHTAPAKHPLPMPPLDQSTASSEAGEWAEIGFQDTGNGITSEELQRIFDPFFTTRPSGTGLGLAIARKILESMGGYIGVESSVGSGTTFRVWLRRAPATVNDQIPMTNDQPGSRVQR
jgi:two-component system sensor histidine kinase PilS (NtrC family)